MPELRKDTDAQEPEAPHRNDARMSLIEAAAKAIHALDQNQSGISWDESTEFGRDWYRADARAALAVFEGAHAEANVSNRGVSDISPEQMSVSAPSPTDDERIALLEKIKLAGHAMAEAMVFQGDSYPVKAIPYTRFLDMLAGFHRTVQGERSDAAVLAALNARELSVRERSGSARHFNPAPDLSYYSDGNVQDMRAALRGAAEAGGER